MSDGSDLSARASVPAPYSAGTAVPRIALLAGSVGYRACIFAHVLRADRAEPGIAPCSAGLARPIRREPPLHEDTHAPVRAYVAYASQQMLWGRGRASLFRSPCPMTRSFQRLQRSRRQRRDGEADSRR